MIMLDDVAIYLEQSGFGVHGKTIFESYSPPFPDDIVILYDYAGLPPNAADLQMLQLSLQVCCRGTYAAAINKAQEIAAALTAAEQYHPLINGTRYFRFAALQPPFKLKTDESGRDVIAQNYRVWARPTETEE